MIIFVLIVWVASLVGAIFITPFTPGWVACALLCGIMGLLIFPAMIFMGAFDEFTWYLFFPGVVGTVASAALILLGVVVPFWRGLGIHEVIVR